MACRRPRGRRPVYRRNNANGGFTNGTSQIYNASATTGSTGYAGNVWPDVVADLRVDQGWGSAQVMGALHQVKTEIDTAATPGQDDIGWAAGAGLTLNLPMIGKGDTVSAQVTYSEGAMAYVGSGLGTGFKIGTGGTGSLGGLGGLTDATAVALGPVGDAVLTGAGTGSTSLEMTTGWSVVAGFQHNWNAQWKTSLYGTYGAISYNDAAKAAALVDDWSMWQVGSRTIWTPVANLDLSVDVMYNHINTAFDGLSLTTGSNVAVIEDKGWWQGMFRVQRNFYP